MGTGAKILLVEDELFMVKALRRKLESEGFKVLTAKTGREGLEVAFGQHPDFILLDLIIPEMDGMAVLTKLREDEWGRDVPVVILTNLYSPEKVKEGNKLGVKDFLIKTDCSINDITKKIKESLNG
jgi:DNA-binding response OmpR family regulator